MIGEAIGSYRITAKLGAGGMGEVYRATDTRLGREVAIKFSAERFSDRFEREARAVAALNHPSICTLYDVGPTYLVMELVEGPTLAERIAQGAIPLAEALGLARQIAAGLEEAHEKGITHRDLKPGNIKVKPDGTVKVLDFGLAKLTGPAEAGHYVRGGDGRGGDDRSVRLQPDLTASPTITSPAAMTQAGMILGTAAYMAPEQAKGKPVDKRADIWAFGVVLYEMITARRPFQGDDIGDVLTAVIKEEPKWDGVPMRVRPLLQRCLEKDPKKRLRDISGVGLLLDAAPPPPAAKAGVLWKAAAASLIVVTAALGATLWRITRPIEQPLVRLDVDLGADVSLGSPQGSDAIISPDGSRLVYVSQNRLFTRRLDQPNAVELAGTQGAFAPFFSPDGQWVAFFATGELKKASVEGGATIALCGAKGGRGGSRGEDGNIIASLNANTLSSVPAAGGQPVAITELVAGEVTHRWPQILPGGEAVLFTAGTRPLAYDEANIEVLSLRDRRRKTLQRGGTHGR
ncbi:MAG: serine/threonine protein kinase [Acidobacteria bacterium]|nr:serine/threonine protein kinase [Acidobacteriota bacterium]